MDDLIKLVKTYRVTAGEPERLRLGDQVFRMIERDLRLFVFGLVKPEAAEDVLQESLKDMAMALGTFRGATVQQFWAWCYRIVRHKIGDHRRKQASGRLEDLPHEEFWQLVEASTKTTPLTPADRHDLEYALSLLDKAKPECREYLWQHFVFGMDYAEIAVEEKITYDTARMRIGRCLEEAQSLVA